MGRYGSNHRWCYSANISLFAWPSYYWTDHYRIWNGHRFFYGANVPKRAMQEGVARKDRILGDLVHRCEARLKHIHGCLLTRTTGVGIVTACA